MYVEIGGFSLNPRNVLYKFQRLNLVFVEIGGFSLNPRYILYKFQKMLFFVKNLRVLDVSFLRFVLFPFSYTKVIYIFHSTSVITSAFNLPSASFASESIGLPIILEIFFIGKHFFGEIACEQRHDRYKLSLWLSSASLCTHHIFTALQGSIFWPKMQQGFFTYGSVSQPVCRQFFFLPFTTLFVCN